MMSIWIIAKQELKLMTRSRWIPSFALLFTTLAVTIVYFSGMNTEAGYDGFTRMTGSLLNLSLFLIPLVTLLTGSSFIAGEKEDGGFSLLLTYALPPRKFLIGKYIGMLIALASVIFLGYGLAGVILLLQHGSISTTLFLLFVFFTLLLTMMFLAVAICIGVISTNRFEALGFSLVVWATLVLFYEFGVVGLITFVDRSFVLPIITVSTLFNPVEIIRVWTILMMNSGEIFGPTLYDFTVWAQGMIGNIAFSSATTLWIISPLILANLFVKKGIRNE